MFDEKPGSFASLAPTEDNQDGVGDEEKGIDEEMNAGRQKQESYDSTDADRYTEDAQIHRAILQANNPPCLCGSLSRASLGASTGCEPGRPAALLDRSCCTQLDRSREMQSNQARESGDIVFILGSASKMTGVRMSMIL